jgi:heparanase 1
MGGANLTATCAATPSTIVHINTTDVLFTTSPRFASWNIDASPNRGFQWRNLSSPNLLALAKGLPAGYLRFGGSGNGALWYGDGIGTQSCNGTTLRNFQCLNATMTNALIALADAADARLVFGLNIDNFFDNHDHPGPGWKWNSTNAEAMVRYLAARGQPYAFELGNEENAHWPSEGLSPAEEAKSFARLAAIVAAVHPNATTRPKIIGPDADYMDPNPTQHAIYKQWVGEFVGNVSSSNAYDVPFFAVTLHEYIDVGWNGSSWLSLDPNVLDRTGEVADDFAGTVRGAWGGRGNKDPPPQLWAGEIGPHNGGSPPCNASSMRWANFANTFWYVDAMATKAAHGFSVFCRQDFIGADYGLLDCAKQTPLPDYYAARLWQKLMGPIVLSASVATASSGSPRRTVRAYSHCEAGGDGVVVLLLNLDDVAVDVDVRADGVGGAKRAGGVERAGGSDRDRTEWHFTAGVGGLGGAEVKLNGAVLQWVLGKLPTMSGAATAAGSLVRMAPQSIVFVRLEDADAAACAQRTIDP